MVLGCSLGHLKVLFERQVGLAKLIYEFESTLLILPIIGVASILEVIMIL